MDAINFPGKLPKAEHLAQKYLCSIHGWVRCEQLHFYGTKTPEPFCPMCLDEETERKEAEGKEKEAVRKRFAYEQDKKIKNIEKEYWGKTFDDFEILSDSQKDALEAVKQMVENKSGKVILLGNNGTGKSMLGSIAVDILGGKILSMYEITTMIRQSYTIKAERTEFEIVSELASIPMLVIDEIGRTKGSDAELNWLSYILDKRHVRDLPFMLLSNGHLSRNCDKGGCPECFENYFNSDILSRLRQNSRIITLNNTPDYRARRKVK